LIGSILRIRYEITGLISEGPIFNAYTARDRVGNRDVCIRVLRSPFNQETAFLGALKGAIEATSKLASPRISALYELDEHEGTNFVVGQACKGMSMAERIKKLAPFSVPVSLGMAISVLEGLEVIHSSGLVHGDVSANNIWVEPDGSASLQLAGIWTAYAYSQTAGAVVLPYMAAYLAPEVSSGSAPSAASDVYAVGVLLCQLLLGRLPYPADTPISMAVKHATEPVPSIRQTNGSIPIVLDEIVKKALSKSPGARYSHATAMLSDLRMLQDALRFGKSLTWPIRPETAKREARPAVAPKMSAVREKIRDRDDDYDLVSGDVPRWLRALFYACILIVGALVTAFFYSNVNKAKMVKVPKLKGLSQNDAKNLLAQSKLRMRILAHIPSDVAPPDTILEIVPSAGTSVRENSDVVVKVSSGSQMVQVPDLKGRTLDEARSILAQVDLEVDDRVDTVEGTTIPRGRIVTEAPEKGTRIERNSRVRVAVSDHAVASNTSTTTPSKPASAKYLYSMKLKLTDLTEHRLVRIEMKDDFGTRKIYEDEHDPNDEFSINAEGFGPKATFEVFYDDQLVATVNKDATAAAPKTP
jgi:eukaryotic-like serine/threonine-protein kinase